MAYGYLGTDGKYIITYRIFIVTARSGKIKKENSASREFSFEKECSRSRTSACSEIGSRREDCCHKVVLR
jgi:hypothetical protein